MKSGKQNSSKGMIKMTNTTSCSDIFGEQYCGSKNKSDVSNLYLAVFVVLAAVLIGLVIANNASLVGNTMLDGTYLGY